MFPISLLCGRFACYPSSKDCFRTSLITSRAREAENLPAPGKGGERALSCAWLCMRVRASGVASHLTAAGARGGLYASFCAELRCPGVNVGVGTALTECSWCAWRWYVAACAVEGSTRMMLSCKRGYMRPLFSVLLPKEDRSTAPRAEATCLSNVII